MENVLGAWCLVLSVSCLSFGAAADVVYGSLTNGQFVAAPYATKIGDETRIVSRLSEEEANGCGLSLCVDERPATDTNHYAVAVGWAMEGRRIVRQWEVRELPPPPPRRFSKLKIYGAISRLGAWPQVKAWLEAKTIDGLNGWEAFQLAQELSEDHPMFQPLAEEARQLLGLSEAQFAAMLDQCVLED